MSNLVFCTLVITGNPDGVRNCLASIGSPGSDSEDARLFDFDRVIPLPRKYLARADVLSVSDEVPGKVVVSVWGTKRNAQDVTVDHQPDDGRARIRFITAWASPHPVIETLADRFPSLGFDLAYSDPQAPYAGRARRAPGDGYWATIEAASDYGFCEAALDAVSSSPRHSDCAAGPPSAGPESAVRGAHTINHNAGRPR